VYKFLTAATAAGLLATSAGATTITVNTFTSASDVLNLAAGGGVVEDFESAASLSGTLEDGTLIGGVNGLAEGELFEGSSISTAVGSFTTKGPIGSGSTCGALSIGDSTCTNIALQQDPGQNGQGNLVPDDGVWSLNSNDTQGIIWTATLGGTLFDGLVFAIADAADAGAKTLRIVAGGAERVFNNLGNNNERYVQISFSTKVDTATVEILTSPNDGFTVDGAIINAVPLPASALLLLGGAGALIGFGRRKAKKA
jgi:hypothetical protein